MRNIPLLSVLPILLATVAPPLPALPALPQAEAQDEKSALRAFKKAFRTSAENPTPAEDRRAAVALLKGHDSKAVAKMLVAAYMDVHPAIATIDLQREEWNEELKKHNAARDKHVAQQKNVKKPTIPRSLYNRIKELRKLIGEQRSEVDGLRQILGDISHRLQQLRATDSLEWLVSSVVSSKKYPLHLKITVARTAGSSADALMPQMMRALKRTKNAGQIVALLDGIGRAGKLGRDATEQVVPLLRHKNALVRERAALTLSQLAVPDAIEPMMDLLERESGPAQKRIAASLEVLTRQQLGTAVGSWRAWWAAEGAEFLSGAKPLGGGEPSIRRERAKNYYMGIPQDGESILYVLDASGSMKNEVDFQLPGAEKQSGLSRLEACKAELIRALGNLAPHKKFNLIWYNDVPTLWKKKMVVADPKLVREAQDWIQPLQPNSSTNIHDAMQMAFGEVAGRGTKDRAYSHTMDLDTIFLLTDGSPTTPEGKPDSTEAILKAVAEWNALKLVQVHCIGIGKGTNTPFLQKLAADNGGEFKKY